MQYFLSDSSSRVSKAGLGGRKTVQSQNISLQQIFQRRTELKTERIKETKI